ncbi:MAG TPA: MFS transporter [Clostridiales bacterium]|nr:MFS transporter [Clostridiales bacterium]
MNRRLLSFVTYTGYFIIGIVSFIISPTLPVIIKDFNITKGVAGAIFTANAAGNFVGVLAGGFFSDLIGKKPLVVLGCLLQIIGFTFTAITGSWALVLGFFFITGMGRGFLNTCFNALIADINTHRRGAAFNTLHGIYGAGCLIGPALAGLMLSLDYEWRVVYYCAAALWMLYMIAIIPITYPAASTVNNDVNNSVHSPAKGLAAWNSKKTYSKRISLKNSDINDFSIRTILFSPAFIMLFIVSFIYNSSATGLIGWINTYLEGMEFSILLGAGMVSIFYLGLTIGRFICRFLSEKVGYSKTILACAIGCFVFYPLIIYATNSTLIAAGVFFSGLFFSGLHPTGLAYANKLFPSISGTITGLLSTAMSLGAMSLPWLIGLVAEKSDFKAGFSIGFVLIIILLGVAISLLLYEKKHRNGSQNMRYITQK